ncbi:hypothetical protein AAFF_G00359490 [Aldrovandia affinis]|uniref:Uncharacterized protein n=1 Tax=Aldrovandia affinis TaxID=143900 RepID=A0AAD7WNB8_9TELE|nr:hypothetical protein AAFF_G00359490 [Aldrovandia affinis]
MAVPARPAGLAGSGLGLRVQRRAHAGLSPKRGRSRLRSEESPGGGERVFPILNPFSGRSPKTIEKIQKSAPCFQRLASGGTYGRARIQLYPFGMICALGSGPEADVAPSVRGGGAIRAVLAPGQAWPAAACDLESRRGARPTLLLPLTGAQQVQALSGI